MDFSASKLNKTVWAVPKRDLECDGVSMSQDVMHASIFSLLAECEDYDGFDWSKYNLLKVTSRMHDVATKGTKNADRRNVARLCTKDDVYFPNKEYSFVMMDVSSVSGSTNSFGGSSNNIPMIVQTSCQQMFGFIGQRMKRGDDLETNFAICVSKASRRLS